MSLKIEDISPLDLPSILELNQISQPHLSSLTLKRLTELAEMTFHFRVIKDKNAVVAFLMGMEEEQPYGSINYAWISERYDSFYYIDRIAVSKEYQNRGLGKALVEDGQSFALKVNKPILICEVNINPPNPGSIKFHESFGFIAIGEQDTECGKKRVQYMIKNLI